MRKPFAERVIASLEEALALTKEEENRLKKTKEGMQEAGSDKYVNEKKLQTNVNPYGIRNDKEPADVPLDIDELSYSKKKKSQFLQVPPNQPAVYDANTAERKEMPKDKKKEKKYDMNRIEQIHSAWQENKKAKEGEKYDINRIEKMKVTRADDSVSPEEVVERSVNMGVSSLKSTAKLLMELLNTLNEDNAYCLAQPWIQNKIALANDYILSIHDYIMFHDEYNDEEKNEPQELSKAPKSDSYFGNFDGHDGHSNINSNPNVQLNKNDYEGGNF